MGRNTLSDRRRIAQEPVRESLDRPSPDRATRGRRNAAERLRAVPDPPREHVAPPRPLAGIALQPTGTEVLRAALEFAREAWGADGGFAASRSAPGLTARPAGTGPRVGPDAFPVVVRTGLDAATWTDVRVRIGRGLGGRVLQDRRPRTSEDYVRDASITPDYVPLMRREGVRGMAVVPVEDLTAGSPAPVPAALLYVTSHATGAPGDRVLAELLRIADMAAVGLVHATGVAPDAAPDTPLTARELELLRLLADGCSNRQIAEDLVIAPSTVKAHLARIYRKLEAPSRLAAVAAGRRLGLL